MSCNVLSLILILFLTKFYFQRLKTCIFILNNNINNSTKNYRISSDNNGFPITGMHPSLWQFMTRDYPLPPDSVMWGAVEHPCVQGAQSDN